MFFSHSPMEEKLVFFQHRAKERPACNRHKLTSFLSMVNKVQLSSYTFNKHITGNRGIGEEVN